MNEARREDCVCFRRRTARSKLSESDASSHPARPHAPTFRPVRSSRKSADEQARKLLAPSQISPRDCAPCEFAPCDLTFAMGIAIFPLPIQPQVTPSWCVVSKTSLQRRTGSTSYRPCSMRGEGGRGGA
ncbi:hypothetical protein BD414DRAFT_497795 [Trametes punicea]|nr:hypothetical protein BD414DRAFT_497795 [Trametes punicea]